MAATAGGVTVVPGGMTSLGLAVPSVKSGPEETTGKGEQQADRSLSPPSLERLRLGG